MEIASQISSYPPSPTADALISPEQYTSNKKKTLTRYYLSTQGATKWHLISKLYRIPWRT